MKGNLGVTLHPADDIAPSHNAILHFNKLLHSRLTVTLAGWCYHLHLIDEETEAQKG